MVNDMEETQITYKIQKMRVGEEQRIIPARLYPVFGEDGEELYCVSSDRKDLRVNIQTFLRGAPRRPLRKGPRTHEVSFERNDYVHTRIASNVPDFHDQVETLILDRIGCHEDELFAFEAEFLLSLFPNLKTVCCHDTVAIENASPELRVLDPFEVGEYSFELAQKKEFDEANRYFRMRWTLDSKWAKFWGEVSRDYKRRPYEHPKFDLNSPMVHDGMDDLFRVYLLGWYAPFPIEEEEKVYVEKHKDLRKALELLPIRFQNCDLHEVSEKLFWDLQYVEDEKNPDYDSFFRVLAETELLYPGTLEQMCEDGWIDDDKKEKFRESIKPYLPD